MAIDDLSGRRRAQQSMKRKEREGGKRHKDADENAVQPSEALLQSEALLPPEGSGEAGAATSAGRCMQRSGGRAGRAARRRARRPAKRWAEAGGGWRRAALRRVSVRAARRLWRAARRAGAGAARARRAPGREKRRGGAGEPRERDGSSSRRKVLGTSKATEKGRGKVPSVCGGGRWAQLGPRAPLASRLLTRLTRGVGVRRRDEK